jgi:hypothetical protein
MFVILLYQEDTDMELIEVAYLLIDKIKKDYKGDIAIVALCGSYIYNDTHQKSDLDFYFIPKTDRGYEMSQCFILNDIGFDFWGMSWERAESLANYNETNTSIISKAKIIYYDSQEDLAQFDALRNIGRLIPKEDFLLKATKQVEVCQDHYFKMLESADNFSLVKQNGISVLYYAAYSISLLNQSYIERGGRNLLNEVLSMPLYPDDFQNMYLKIIRSDNIDEMLISAETVILNLRSLIQKQREPVSSSITQGYYEEIKSIYNKLLHECETDNQQGIMLAIARLDRDVSQLLHEAGYSYSQFPDLFSISKQRNNNVLIQAIQSHEKMFIETLNANGVPIICYRNLDEFRVHLDI